jgi:hypothetical protein
MNREKVEIEIQKWHTVPTLKDYKPKDILPSMKWYKPEIEYQIKDNIAYWHEKREMFIETILLSDIVSIIPELIKQGYDISFTKSEIAEMYHIFLYPTRCNEEEIIYTP